MREQIIEFLLKEGSLYTHKDDILRVNGSRDTGIASTQKLIDNIERFVKLQEENIKQVLINSFNDYIETCWKFSELEDKLGNVESAMMWVHIRNTYEQLVEHLKLPDYYNFAGK